MISRRLKEGLRNKGYNPRGFLISFVLLWFLFEISGIILFYTLLDVIGLATYPGGLIGIGVFIGLSYFILGKLSPKNHKKSPC
jgi:hypothetical protein